MIELKRAGPSDLRDIYTLWQAEFGDAPSFIDSFCAWCGWEQLFILREDGIARGITAIPLTEVVMPGGERASAAYLYAHTTHKEYRGEGFGHIMLRYADFCLQNQKIDCVVLVPAQPSLFPYFASAGYETAFSLWEGVVFGETLGQPPSDCEIREITGEGYLATQEERLAGLPHMAAPLGLLEQTCLLSRGAGGGMYGLELSHGSGCAVVEPMKNGRAFIRELLTHVEDRDAALSLIHQRIGARAYVLRRPLEDEEEVGAKPFGVIKWYDENKATRWGGLARGYFGLAMD